MKTMKRDIGTFSAALKPSTRTDGKTKVYFKVFISALSSKKERARDLLYEVLTKTEFNDCEAMENIVKQAYIASEESFSQAGHRAAKSRASAMQFTEGAVNEYYSGYEAHLRYKALSKSFEAEIDVLREKLKSFISKYLVRDRLTVSLAEGEREDSESFMRSVADLFVSSEKKTEPECKIRKLKRQREGIKIPAKVAFSSLVLNTESEGIGELGRAAVASNLISFEYLWGEIRVKGGAYGAGMSSVRTGQTSFYSYRDPTPKRSIEKMKDSPSFLSEALGKKAEIEKYIIGAIGETSPYLTPRSRANIAVHRHLSCLTDEMRLEMREQILTANKENLSLYAKKLAAAMKEAAYCIVAPRDMLGEECELDAILDL